ncbi:hypothetical protein N9578_00040 [bacterium]|nr:hypothetical protein [bacterium]
MKIQDILTENCWKGYKKDGMKTMYGKRVPNCLKKQTEQIEEELRAWFGKAKNVEN